MHLSIVSAAHFHRLPAVEFSIFAESYAINLLELSLKMALISSSNSLSRSQIGQSAL